MTAPQANVAAVIQGAADFAEFGEIRPRRATRCTASSVK